MGNALWVYGTIYKVKTGEKIYLVEIWLPSQNAGTRVSLLYTLVRDVVTKQGGESIYVYKEDEGTMYLYNSN